MKNKIKHLLKKRKAMKKEKKSLLNNKDMFIKKHSKISFITHLDNYNLILNMIENKLKNLLSKYILTYLLEKNVKKVSFLTYDKIQYFDIKQLILLYKLMKSI